MMAVLKEKERMCKHCKFSFGGKVEMFYSTRFGHWICQKCFHEFREKKLIP